MFVPTAPFESSTVFFSCLFVAAAAPSDTEVVADFDFVASLLVKERRKKEKKKKKNAN